jgi:RNA processing factor Prp31
MTCDGGRGLASDEAERVGVPEWEREVVFDDDGEMAELKGFELKRRGELKMIKLFQTRVVAAFLRGSDLASCYAAVAETAQVSMGTDISAADLESIRALAEQVVGLMGYRRQLSDYLANRMHAIAPNLTMMVGELVGARLIAHAGSLLNLAKHPASTIQILGAEKVT